MLIKFSKKYIICIYIYFLNLKLSACHMWPAGCQLPIPGLEHMCLGGSAGGGHFWKDVCCVTAGLISVRNTHHMSSCSLASIATRHERTRADSAFTYTRVTDYNNKERTKRRSGGESETQHFHFNGSAFLMDRNYLLTTE